MAYITLPTPERTKSGFEAFSEGFSPGLEKAFQLALQRKLEEEQRKRAYQEAENLGLITKQPYQEVPIEGGTAQIAPLRGIEHPVKYKFKPSKGTGITFKDNLPQFSYEQPDELTTANKRAQLNLTNKILENYEQGTAGNRIFRDINTGEEIDENSALMGMQAGKQYNVFLRTPTRSGSRETKVAEPPKLTENEKDFVGGYKQASKDVDSLIEQLTPQTKAPLGGFARISTRKRFLVPEPELRKLQEPYTRVIKTFLFGPAGKALTGTEREVLEMAASPTGKSSEEWERDIKAAKQVLDDKYNLLTQRQYPVAQGQQDFSQMSDEELRRIALGG